MLFRSILTHFQLEPFEEDAFESLSCYFPVDFSPPKGSDICVTKEDLVLALRQCFAAQPLFAPLAFPLFLDKLDSDLAEAKIDANLTLVQCLPKYTNEQIQPHMEQLWTLLKKEVLGKLLNLFLLVHLFWRL